MLADAIRMGYEKIIIHRIHEHKWARDYIAQKAGLDFWCGYALGRGIIIEVSSDSALIGPYFWELDMYGYSPDDWTQDDYDHQNGATEILVDAVKQISEHMDIEYRPRPKILIPMGRDNG